MRSLLYSLYVDSSLLSKVEEFNKNSVVVNSSKYVCKVYNFFLMRWQTNFHFTFPVFIGHQPIIVRRNNKQNKGASWRISSYLIQMTKTVQRYQTLDISTYIIISPTPQLLGFDLLKSSMDEVKQFHKLNSNITNSTYMKLKRVTYWLTDWFTDINYDGLPDVWTTSRLQVPTCMKLLISNFKNNCPIIALHWSWPFTHCCRVLFILKHFGR